MVIVAVKKKFITTAYVLLTIVFCFYAINPVADAKVDGYKRRYLQNTNTAFAFSNLSSKFSSWGISPFKTSSINLANAWKKFKGKENVTVAVVDTGIDPKHIFLQNNIKAIKRSSNSINFGRDFSKNSLRPYQPIDTHGHGTHVTGIIKSIMPTVKILTLKYYNPQVSGLDNLKATIKALEYAVQQNVDIINYSGGGAEPSIEELRILKDAESRGILVVAASGNNHANIDVKINAYYPASYGLSNIISVTAHDMNLNILPSSNYGATSVDIAAPGNRIKSSIPQNRAGYMTGTSQATAFVTGVAALLKSQFPTITATQIKSIIRKSAKKEKTLKGKCSSEGRLDAEKALTIAESIMGTPPPYKQRSLAKIRSNGTK